MALGRSEALEGFPRSLDCHSIATRLSLDCH